MALYNCLSFVSLTSKYPSLVLPSICTSLLGMILAVSICLSCFYYVLWLSSYPSHVYSFNPEISIVSFWLCPGVLFIPIFLNTSFLFTCSINVILNILLLNHILQPHIASSFLFICGEIVQPSLPYKRYDITFQCSFLCFSGNFHVS